jgi:hypothetical protein
MDGINTNNCQLQAGNWINSSANMQGGNSSLNNNGVNNGVNWPNNNGQLQGENPNADGLRHGAHQPFRPIAQYPYFGSSPSVYFEKRHAANVMLNVSIIWLI